MPINSITCSFALDWVALFYPRHILNDSQGFLADDEKYIAASFMTYWDSNKGCKVKSPSHGTFNFSFHVIELHFEIKKIIIKKIYISIFLMCWKSIEVFSSTRDSLSHLLQTSPTRLTAHRLGAAVHQPNPANAPSSA